MNFRPGEANPTVGLYFVKMDDLNTEIKVDLDVQERILKRNNINVAKNLNKLASKWGVSSRWSFVQDPAWGSKKTTAIGNTHPTLILTINS